MQGACEQGGEGVKLRRPTSEWEAKAIMALKACRLLPGHPHKRFAKSLEVDWITPAQANFLVLLVNRYRRQMPESVLAEIRCPSPPSPVQIPLGLEDA